MVTLTAVDVIGLLAYQAIAARQRVFVGPVRSVEVNVGTGSVVIERGSGSDAVVDTSGARGVSSPTDDEHLHGGALVITSTCGSTFFSNHCVRNYVVRVPSTVSVVAGSDQGDVTATGIDGALRLHSDQGDVTVRGGRSPVAMSSDQGDVTATGLGTRSVKAHSDQGNVTLRFLVAPVHVTASSDQGDVDVRLPRGPVAYRVQVGSDQGNASNEIDTDPTSGRTVHASSTQGNVTVSYP